MHVLPMLQLLTTDAFADWFGSLPDGDAEDVATALDMIEQRGLAVAEIGAAEPTGPTLRSSEALLWYEDSTWSTLAELDGAWKLEAWGDFRAYAKRVLEQLDSPEFRSRLSELTVEATAIVLESVRRIRRVTDPRAWQLRGGILARTQSSSDPREEVRTLHAAALNAAGLRLDARALRQLAHRPRGAQAAGKLHFRVLYGVDVERKIALIVLGEALDRNYYGDSVRTAERVWQEFLQGRYRNRPRALRREGSL
jgi:hypothetical protein